MIRILREKLSPYHGNCGAYRGKPLETGGTSIPGKAAPGVQEMYKKGYFDGAQTVLDYGAGRYARNADYLRRLGFDVYAYDKFHDTGVDPWSIGGVSTDLPEGYHFDVGFSAYVINVVPEDVEEDIVAEVERYSDEQYHISRNADIREQARHVIKRNDPAVREFIFDHLNIDIADIKDPRKHPEMVACICYFGFPTARGLQRISQLDLNNPAYTVLEAPSGYILFGRT